MSKGQLQERRITATADAVKAPAAAALVSGRYGGAGARFEVDLRVDLDGPRSTHRVSADYTRTSDGTPTGSMHVPAPLVTATAAAITVTGTADCTWPTRHRAISITIPRPAAGASGSPPTLTLRHLDARGRVGATYTCTFVSSAYRSVVLEEATQVGVTRFDSCDTGALPSGGRARTLSLVAAFAEAGIELQTPDPPTVVDTAAAGAGSAWSDAELHAAMQARFTRWRDEKQWAVWLLHATRHDGSGPGGAIQGLMFDQRGVPRQGCAVFYDTMPGDGPDSRRRQLYTCVHELAHTLNLTHCWQKSYVRPPVPSRPNAATWMNYPDLFPGGEAAYWRAFGFEFDSDELTHLRHAFRDDIIMGGAALGFSDVPADGAAGPASVARSASVLDAGLHLALGAPAAVGFGVPVTIDLELSATSHEGRMVPTVLGPRPATVDVLILDPHGKTVSFEPLLHHCRDPHLHLLRAGDPPVRDAAFIHYGRDGYMFEEPGQYWVRARYTGIDGSFVDSAAVPIVVRRPASAGDRLIGELTYRDDQVGVLMSVVGSDADALRGGNDALREIIARFPRHPSAAIARVVLGANAARQFKAIDASGTVRVRQPDLALARRLVDPVIDVARLETDTGLAPAGAPAPRRIATRAGVASSVDAFIRSRVDEIVMEVPTIVGRRPATEVAAIPGPVRVAGPTRTVKRSRGRRLVTTEPITDHDSCPPDVRPRPSASA